MELFPLPANLLRSQSRRLKLYCLLSRLQRVHRKRITTRVTLRLAADGLGDPRVLPLNCHFL